MRSSAPLRTLIAICAFLVLPSQAGRAIASPTQVRYRGMLVLEAHFRHPGDTRTYQSLQEFSTDGVDRARLDWTTWEERDSARVPEAFLVVGDSVFHRDAPDARWVLLGGERARLGWWQAVAGLPDMLERTANAPAAIRGLLISERSHGRFASVHESLAHPRLGDVVNSIDLTYAGGDSVPDSLRQVLYERDQNWSLREARTSAGSDPVADSLLRSPADFDAARVTDESMTAEPVIGSVAPGIWAAEMEDIGSRSLIVEFADHLAVLEFAVGSANGERIADAARRRWPHKPIRYALFSHYHPHYAGGVRAMIAEGATIVTTPGNEAFVRAMAARPWTIAPDRLAPAPKPVNVRTFQDRLELADKANDLVAIDYGARSNHTDEFVVFWFPRAKLLFETELGWFMRDGKLVASRRAAPLLAWIDEQKLDVERIVQSWPMRGEKRELTRAELAALAKPAPRP